MNNDWDTLERLREDAETSKRLGYNDFHANPKTVLELFVITARPDSPNEELREATGRFLRRVGGLTVEFRDGKAFLPVRDDWVGDLEAGYRAALAAEAPERPASDTHDVRGHFPYDGYPHPDDHEHSA